MRPPSLPESCSHLTSLYGGDLFAVEDWRCSGADTPARQEEWSSDDRVVVTRRGAWELEVEGAARRADPVTVALWNRGPYRVRHPVGGRDECTVFRLTAAGTGALGEAVPSRGCRGQRGTFIRPTRLLDGRAYLLHRRALSAAALGSPDPVAVEEPALEFLRIAAAHAESARAIPDAATGRRHVAGARDILARDFRRPLTIGHVARQVNCSPFHLSRLFRRATGVTLYQAVLRLRLREGLERLLDVPDGIASIALAVGFASHSHFTDAFRAEFGCPPSHARRLLRTGP